MRELALHILDIAQNSVSAKALAIDIILEEDDLLGRLCLTVRDNGSGMDEHTLARARDPFFTTKAGHTTGLGIPLLKMAALATGGQFDLNSQPGVGTQLQAHFFCRHIDMIPLGHIEGTVRLLEACNPGIRFTYTHKRQGKASLKTFTKVGKVMKSVEQLTSLREKLSENIYIRDNNHKGTRIVVNMGTCGIATGARDVLAAIVQEIKKQRLQVQVSLSDCGGDCSQEPMFEVSVPGKEKVLHVKMTPEQAGEVICKLATT